MSDVSPTMRAEVAARASRTRDTTIDPDAGGEFLNMLQATLHTTHCDSAIVFALALVACGTVTRPTLAQGVADSSITVVGGVAGDLSPSREAFIFAQPPKVLPKLTKQNHVMVAIKTNIRFTGKKALIRSTPKAFSASTTTSYYEVEVLEGKHKGQVVWMSFYALDKVPKDIKGSKPISEPD